MLLARHPVVDVGEPGVEVDAMMSGYARICSPWKPNSRIRVANSATSESGCSVLKRPVRAASPPLASS
jgi:hypothetical protein